jgi:hypothetical protein
MLVRVPEWVCGVHVRKRKALETEPSKLPGLLHGLYALIDVPSRE